MHEGEIELKNKEPQELMSDNRETDASTNQVHSRKSKYLSKSAIYKFKEGQSSDDKMNLLWKENTKSQWNDFSEEEREQQEDYENISDSSFTLKRPSLVDFYLKTQSCNLGKLNLKVLGFKTYFNGYMEDIEVYAEPIESEESGMSSSFADVN